MKCKKVKRIIIGLLAVISAFSLAACGSGNQDYTDHTVAKYHPQGASVAIIENGQITEVKNYGKANVEKNTPVTDKTTFKVASISKVVTAYTVMHLVDEGNLDLDKPIATYLTRWQLPPGTYDNDKVTLRTLLSHTSGVSGSDEKYTKPYPDIATALNEKNIHLIREPGEVFKYSEFSGLGICQLVVEEVVGERFEDYVTQNVFQKLGMNDTSYSDESTGDCTLATPYAGFGEPIAVTHYVMAGAAGVTTTSSDLAKFVIALMDYYNTDTEMFQVQKNAQTDLGACCLGIFLQSLADGGRIYEHNGTFTGWNAQFVFEPDSRNGMVLVTNSDQAFYMTYDMMDQWGQHVLGQSVKVGAIDSLSKKTLCIAIIFTVFDGLVILLLVYRIFSSKLMRAGKEYKGTVVASIISAIVMVSTLFLFYTDIPFNLLFHLQDNYLFTFFTSAINMIVIDLAVFCTVVIIRTRFIRNRRSVADPEK